jgi:hypothetical protein
MILFRVIHEAAVQCILGVRKISFQIWCDQELQRLRYLCILSYRAFVEHGRHRLHKFFSETRNRLILHVNVTLGSPSVITMKLGLFVYRNTNEVR